MGLTNYYTLTPKELEVTRMVSYAYTNNQIADLLCMSPKTVERHITEIYSKLIHNGEHKRVAIARWYWDNYNEDGDKKSEVPKRYLVIELGEGENVDR